MSVLHDSRIFPHSFRGPAKWALAALLTAAATGCGFLSSSYRETREFDLNVPPVKLEEKLPPVRFGVFRNFSGAGLPVLVRESGSRVTTDVYNRWLMSPEQMLERELRRNLDSGRVGPGMAGRIVRLSGSILKFEFDREHHCARLEVEFDAELIADNLPVRAETADVFCESPVEGKGVEAVAGAMGRCVADAVTAAGKLAAKLAAEPVPVQKSAATSK